ncbi:MAG: hypothetical protein J7501_04475, partial [Bdellovibrio sp.]|nr:hypothetical protein [Bdellovibrio sp.]
MKLVARVSTPNSTVPATASKQITSKSVLAAIKSQIANKEYSRAVLHEREGVALITYIIQSRNNPNVFFIFSAPLLTLFEKIDLRASESMDIEDTDSGHGWTITSDGTNKSIRYNPDILTVENSETTLQTLRLGEPQQTGLKVHFHFSPSEPKGYLRPPVITALLSILLTWIVSYLFWVLVTQNRQVSRMVIEKTHDLEKTHQDLQEALLTKSRFLGSISHEIRTPLNLILGMIDLCQEKDTDNKVKEYLASMKSSGNH